MAIEDFYDSPQLEFEKTRKDILYIPWLYKPNYCVEQNVLFSKVFTSFPAKECQYQRDKQIELYKYNIEVMKNLRVSSKTYSGIYYNNIIDDFDIHHYLIGGIDKIYGFQHDSYRQSYLKKKSNPKNLLIEHEDSIGKMATKIFVGTNYMKGFLPYNTDVIGLPIFVEKQEPRNDNGILFNHRFAKEKNWHMLFELPDVMKKELKLTTPTIACPSSYGIYFTKSKKELGLISGCEKSIVDNFQSNLGFGLSFSIADNFGISVLEGIMSGLFYMCYENEYNCFSELLLPEFLFKSVDECVEKYKFYKENTKKRFDIVRQQQELLSKYQPKQWVKTLLEKID